jgi:hypothetical protein
VIGSAASQHHVGFMQGGKHNGETPMLFLALSLAAIAAIGVVTARLVSSSPVLRALHHTPHGT